MKARSVWFALSILAVALVIVACGQSAPAPTAAPAKPTSEPAKAASPAAPSATTAPAAPSAAPAAKVGYPEKGKPITILVGFTAGAVADNSTRLLASLLEKDLGTSVQIVNKTGASTQIAMAELVKAKPDGYTLGTISVPTIIVTYLDTERNAPYDRKSFEKVSMFAFDYDAIGVPTGSPFKNMKDYLDAAKANPSKIQVGTSGLLGVNHLGQLALEQAAGVQFGYVHFPGAADARTALLGGHLDSANLSVGNLNNELKASQVDVLCVMAEKRSEFMPGIETCTEEGYKVVTPFGYGLSAPAGTPKAIVDVLDAAVKKAVSSPEYQEKIKTLGMIGNYMDAAGFDKYWTDEEEKARPLIEIGKEKK